MKEINHLPAEQVVESADNAGADAGNVCNCTELNRIGLVSRGSIVASNLQANGEFRERPAGDEPHCAALIVEGTSKKLLDVLTLLAAEQAVESADNA